MKRPLPHHRSRNAFTVIEMLVVIGILVVVSLGVATIFQSVGETVARGRKLSELNQFASRMERVMREDFQRMTRDGFLVIINKNAGYSSLTGQVEDTLLYRGQDTDQDGNGVPGRIRRSDEIMFFARGDYVSQRRPIAPNMIASSNEAAIYYGHGQKRRPDLFTDRPSSVGVLAFDPVYDGTYNYFFNPQPWDNNFDPAQDTRLGVRTTGLVNPNEFARDWSLLRVVTLLTNPQGAGQTVPRELFGFDRDQFNPAPGAVVDRDFLLDSPRQIMLQPAARSIFKSLAASGDTTLPPSIHDVIIGTSAFPLPQTHPYFNRTSGVVDIVTQDLASIRTEIQGLSAGAAPALSRPSNFLSVFDAYGRAPQPAPNGVIQTRDGFESIFYQSPTTFPNASDALLPRPNGLELGRQHTSGSWNTTGNEFDNNDAQRIREWMIDALPSAWNPSSVLTHDAFVSGVRYEDIPTRILFNTDDFDGSPNPDLARALAEANQEMLGSSIFVPRCTEFVVEWSYGFVNQSITNTSSPDYKRLIWYGLDRLVDSNNDGVLNANEDQLAASTYWPRPDPWAGNLPSSGGVSVDRPRGPDARLVVGRSFDFAGLTSPDVIEAACFGFSTQPGAERQDLPVEGTSWPWPKLVRITMTLGDPNDRDVEETYQIILEIPEPE